jgi:hypothetical protein
MGTAEEVFNLLKQKLKLRELAIYIPNNPDFPEDSLDTLKDFPSLQSLAIRDARESKSERFYKQVAAVKGVKELSISFL